MRLLILKGLLALAAAQSVSGSSWFGRTVYNKWHETELERWLSDHNIPYPTPADRRDLENLVKENWDNYVVAPYNKWDTTQLQKYIAQRGEALHKGAADTQEELVKQVKATWTDTEDTVSDAYANVRDWIFDSWTESQLKAFADRNGIPVPQPRTRDTLLKAVRANYQTAANKLGESAAYPGDWLYATWTDSDLKRWCDERGIPVYQGSKRADLIAAVRRNSRAASMALAAWTASVAAAAASATQGVADAVFDAWSDSELKRWADERGIRVPQGSTRNEVVALLRRHNAALHAEADRAYASAAKAYGAATSSAGNEYARATDDAAARFERVQSVVYEYVGWLGRQVGLASEAAGKTAAGASKAASQTAADVSRSARSATASASKKAQKAKEEL